MKKRIILTLAISIISMVLLAVSVSAIDLITSTSDEFGTVTVVDGMTSTVTDTTAKVVLKNEDGTFSTYYTYYIYPTLNWRGGMSAPNFDGLNEALGTLYINASIVRIELVSDCKYIELPSDCNTYLKELLIPEDINTTTLYRTYFKALEKINIPSKITTISSNTFDGTTTLKYVTFGDDFAMTSLPAAMFCGCSSLEEIRLPNSVTSIGNSFFANCTSLKRIYLGENLDKIGISILVNVTNAKIYASSKWFTTNAPAHNSFAYDGHAPTDVTLYYVGTKAEAEALAAKSNHNGIKNATLVEYDATKSDDYYVNPSQTAWTIVYGYNKCKAFYDNEHLPSQTTYEFEGEKYLSVCNAYSGCPRCLQSVPTKVCDALFVNKGYSKEKDGTSFTYGILINATEIEKYEQALGTTLDYGFIIQSYKDGDDGKILGADGVAQEGALVLDFTEITNLNLTIYNLKITGIQTQAQQSFSLYCAAYIIDGANVSYIGASATDAAVPVTYLTIPTKED